jgi:23S rRNA pseudouridine1911/1915/1917 synthase
MDITRIVRPKKRMRLDKYLKLSGLGISRSLIQKLIQDGNVLVDGKPAKTSHILYPGQEIKLVYQKPEKFIPVPQDIPLNIVYEDHDLIVINKPSGMVTHPAPSNLKGTLVNALLYHCNLSGGTKTRPGVVHRLDKDTSGLLVFAKSDKAHRRLANQVERHLMRRIYVALAWGDFELQNGTIDAPIGRHLIEREKMAVTPLSSREAQTSFKVKERFGDITLLSLKLKTGRTHQIRVHLSHINHPIVGDSTYGGRRRYPYVKVQRFKDIMGIIKRQALHAAVLGFKHPASNDWIEFEAPLPQDMQNLLKYLKRTALSS